AAGETEGPRQKGIMLSTRLAMAAAAVVLGGCGSTPPADPAAAAAPAVKTAPAAVVDHSAVLPATGLVGSRLVPDHILDVPKLPGGVLGEYSVKGKKYQIFIVDAGTNQSAAFLLLDLKATLQKPEYLSYMGGYAGSDGTREIYAFAKKQYLAGVVGLPKAAADPVAIELAGHLN
ncbi:MAG: hypothetical protein ABUS49_05175, partial [Acidobacteriota bacterium]